MKTKSERKKLFVSKLKNKLKEQKGISMTTISFGKIMLIIFIFYLIFTMLNIIYLLTNTRNLIEDATIETVQKNYAKVYHTSRESYSGGYRPSDTGFYESYINDNTSLVKTLSKNDKFTLMEEDLLKLSKNGQKLYAITGIKMNLNNEPIQSGTKKFVVTTRYIFEYPISFWGKEYLIKIPMKVQAKHTSKY